MTSPLKPCVIVDLDGTLLRGNSLRMMIRFLAAKLWREGRYGNFAKIATLLAARRLRLISHVAMKHPIHVMAASILTSAEIETFVKMLSRDFNRELLQRLAEYRRRGYRLILATAAPALYIPALSRMLGTVWGFDAFIATPLSATPADYREARGERKLMLCLDRAAKEGWEIRAVATDHVDDLPLLRLPGIHRLLVNSAPSLRQTLTTLHLPFEAI